MFDEIRLLLQQAIITDNEIIRRNKLYETMIIAVALEDQVRKMEFKLQEHLEDEV